MSPGVDSPIEADCSFPSSPSAVENAVREKSENVRHMRVGVCSVVGDSRVSTCSAGSCINSSCGVGCGESSPVDAGNSAWWYDGEDGDA